MKAFYTLLNFSKGPIFFEADKSSFHITLLKGTTVKTSKEKYTPQRFLHTYTLKQEVYLSPANPFFPRTEQPAAHLGQGSCG